ncbi:cyclin-like protein [Syncephalis plumigaleata]|nr:cyclin-like protein [Syncephalis plumigaleata]
MPCQGCGGNTFEHDDVQGNAFCVQCGVVFEENALSKEVEFGEKSNGAAVLMGSYIGANQGRAMSFGLNRRQTTMESKEQSMANGRRRIQALATALRISERYVDAAQRYFNLALAYNFTRGRTTQSVAAACLYIACRMERTSHMLIDFSDVLQINVFALGNTFLKLVKELSLRLPLVDPSIYIHRFAAMLEFGDATPVVASDALRLVQRMNRDWIQTGRRPAGICGACLLIAARMHNFRRTSAEVMRVVKIGDATLKRRMEEFMATPSSKLTMADFQSMFLEESYDPPAFIVGKMRMKPLIAEVTNTETDSSAQALLKEAATALMSMNGSTPKQPEMEKVDENVENWTDIDDDEIEQVFLTQDEVVMKTELWEENNRDYIEKMAEREKREAAGEKFAPRPSRKRRRRGDVPVDESSRSAAESAKKMLFTKKFSRKINYAVIDALFDDEPTATEKEEEAAAAMSPIKYEIVEEPGVEPVKSDMSNNSSSVASPESGKPSQDNTNSSELQIKNEALAQTTNTTATTTTATTTEAAAEEEEEEEEYDDDDDDEEEYGNDDMHAYGYDEYNDYD